VSQLSSVNNVTAQRGWWLTKSMLAWWSGRPRVRPRWWRRSCRLANYGESTTGPFGPGHARERIMNRGGAVGASTELRW